MLGEGSRDTQPASLELAATASAPLGEDPRERHGIAEVAERARVASALGLGLEEDAPPRVGRYRVLETLGRGGMGVVVAAHDEQLDRRVALKFLHDSGLDRSGRGRLIREARSLAQLSHPNVVQIHEVGESDGTPYIAMELVRGGTLRQWVAGVGADGAPTRREILDVFVQIGRGLAAAHDVGVVHRDFKPENVLVGGDDGRPRVLDFGLARLGLGEGPGIDWTTRPPTDAAMTATGAVMGTPAYMAPEQWRGQPADARSDQFSYCVALFEALYGEAPFAAASVPETMTRVLSGVAPEVAEPERVPAALHAAILRGLSVDADARWPSMAPLLEHVDQVLTSAEQGIFAEGGPVIVVRYLGPLFAGIPLLWLLVELAGLVDYAAMNWLYLTAAQFLFIAPFIVSIRKRVEPMLVHPRLLLFAPFMAALMLMHRLVTVLTGTAVEAMFAFDYATMMVGATAIVVIFERRVWPTVLHMLVVLVLALVRPSWAPRLWVLFTLGIPLTILPRVYGRVSRLRRPPGGVESRSSTSP